MSEKKSIDRLFQEKFKDFEVNPPEDAWAVIEARLDGKKRRRLIPFWWKLGGIAAVFLIGFLVSKSIYDDGSSKPANPVVKEERPNAGKEKSLEDVNSEFKNNGRVNEDSPVVNKTNTEKSTQQNTESTNKVNGSIPSNAVAETNTNKPGNNAVSGRKNTNKKAVLPSESTVAERKSAHYRSLKNKLNAGKNNAPPTEIEFEKSQNPVAQNQKINSPPITKKESKVNGEANQIVQTNSDEKNKKGNQVSTDNNNINLDDLKGKVDSKIATKEVEKKVNDTAAISVANNELEKLLNEKESTSKSESKRNRWQLASNVAPVFLGSVSNGSPIDSTLSKNSKSYNTNVGFGIGVSYAVTKKLSIRTGVNKVNMSYDTNDISFFTGIQAKTLQGVNPTATSEMIHVESSNAQVSSDVSPEAALLPFENAFAHKSTGYLRQEMGYLEMPVELTYNLLDKKFGLKIIGGFSTLFLQDNSIMIISEGRDTLLGEANNLNDVHFSTNIGLGLKYNFLKSFEFNVEPTVKYQLNTYSSNAGNFKPYLFGIYSGISYKF